MHIAIMVLGIVGWVSTGNGLFLATAILGGILLGCDTMLGVLKVLSANGRD